jgi:hypothetical protein
MPMGYSGVVILLNTVLSGRAYTITSKGIFLILTMIGSWIGIHSLIYTWISLEQYTIGIRPKSTVRKKARL